MEQATAVSGVEQATQPTTVEEVGRKISANVKKYRQALNLSQVNLALKAKTSLASVHRLENCIQPANIKTLVALANALQVTTAQIVE